MCVFHDAEQPIDLHITVQFNQFKIGIAAYIQVSMGISKRFKDDDFYTLVALEVDRTKAVGQRCFAQYPGQISVELRSWQILSI